MGILNSIKNKFMNKPKKDTFVSDPHVDAEIDFVWGVKSVSDYSNDMASPFTLNDIAIYFDNNTSEYVLFVETGRCFEKDKKDECRFLKRILNEFTVWMNVEGYDTTKKFEFAFVSTENLMAFSDVSIERLYSRFKVFVKGFLAVYG